MKSPNDNQLPDKSIEPPAEIDRAEDSLAAGPPSVIQRIGEITGSKPLIMLRDDSACDTPLIKPLGHDERIDAGKYTVHGELGCGGVGTVHRGHDQDLGRDVAMKFLHEKYTANPVILQRFVEEAQIGGQLQHPGIVPVYDLGMVDGRPFFAMKLVKGQTLAKKLAERESPSDDRGSFLAIFEDICQTVAYAHERGVVHRDLKPANIMIGSFGEVQVVDWGMGKVMRSGGVDDEKFEAKDEPQLSIIETVRSDGHGTQSIIGSVMGTPSYMPPEQARGDVDAMDERSDVFALGAILCEILTGQPPYVGDFDEIISMAAMAKLDDAHARLAQCNGEPEMVELVTRCLMPAPVARPRSAKVVAKIVHDHLAAVESRVHEARVETAEAKVRAASLKRTQTLGIGLIGVIAAGFFVSLFFWRAADTAATNENIAKLAAEASAQLAQDHELLAVEQTEIATRELARALEIKGLITEMLQSVTPEQAQGADITLLRGILDMTSKRLADDVIEDELVAAELHALTGDVYHVLGLYPEAEVHLPVVLEIRQRALGKEHTYTLNSAINLANLYSSQARYPEAEMLLLETLEILTRVQGEENRSTLAGMSSLAALFLLQGRYAEAELLLLKTLKIQKRVLSEEHPRTLDNMSDLASIYIQQGRYAEAEPISLQTRAIQMRLLGEEDLSTLVSTGNLAMLYMQQGRHAEAETLMLQTVEIKKRVQGAEHPSTLGSMGNLASLYRGEMGRYAEAEELYLETLEIEKRVLGEEHRGSVSTMGNLASLYLFQDRYAEAEALMLKTMKIEKRTLGLEHPSTLSNMGNLASLYKQQGRYAEAETLHLQTLEIKKRVLGPEHPIIWSSMCNLASLYKEQGRYLEAETLYVQALEVRKRLSGLEHEKTLSVMLSLAQTYRALPGRYADAESLYLQKLEIEERMLGKEHLSTLVSVGDLGYFYMHRERYAEAEVLFLQTLEIKTRKLGKEHRETLRTNMDLGLLYNSMGRYEDAAALLEISLPIKRRVLGLQHTWTLSAMSDLVDAYLGLGRGDDALPLQREVLSLELVSADSESTSANELNSAAWTLLTFVDENLRDPERALGYSQRAVAMEEESGGALSWAFLDTLALAQHKTGNTTGAIETQRRALALMPAGASPEVAQHLAEYEATLRDN